MGFASFHPAGNWNDAHSTSYAGTSQAVLVPSSDEIWQFINYETTPPGPFLRIDRATRANIDFCDNVDTGATLMAGTAAPWVMPYFDSNRNRVFAGFYRMDVTPHRYGLGSWADDGSLVFWNEWDWTDETLSGFVASADALYCIRVMSGSSYLASVDETTGARTNLQSIGAQYGIQVDNTGDVWVAADGDLYKWDASGASWSTIFTHTSGSDYIDAINYDPVADAILIHFQFDDFAIYDIGGASMGSTFSVSAEVLTPPLGSYAWDATKSRFIAAGNGGSFANYSGIVQANADLSLVTRINIPASIQSDYGADTYCAWAWWPDASVNEEIWFDDEWEHQDPDTLDITTEYRIGVWTPDAASRHVTVNINMRRR